LISGGATRRIADSRYRSVCPACLPERSDLRFFAVLCVHFRSDFFRVDRTGFVAGGFPPQRRRATRFEPCLVRVETKGMRGNPDMPANQSNYARIDGGRKSTVGTFASFRRPPAPNARKHRS
jgi:hypothetical protein